jgi:hypothetical protein
LTIYLNNDDWVVDELQSLNKMFFKETICHLLGILQHPLFSILFKSVEYPPHRSLFATLCFLEHFLRKFKGLRGVQLLELI